MPLEVSEIYGRIFLIIQQNVILHIIVIKNILCKIYKSIVHYIESEYKSYKSFSGCAG